MISKILARLAVRGGTAGSGRAATVLRAAFTSRPPVLSWPERNEAIRSLTDGGGFSSWREGEENGRTRLTKTYEFSDFSEAFAFMTQGAALAERMDHHPEWSNVYNRVEVNLTTHSMGGVTDKDVEMAKLFDEYAKDILPSQV